MKKIIQYLWILPVGILFISCEKFLTEIPLDTYTTDSKYKNQADFVQAIAGVYSSNMGLYSDHAGWFSRVNLRSDDSRTGGDYTYGFTEFTENNVDVTFLNNGWKQLFKIITFSNLILDKIDGGEFTDAKMKEYIRGEALFFRAYAYWTLCWQFGGMPLYKKEMSIEEIRKIPRSTQDETFDFSIADYKSAYDLLPEEWSNENRGRITKYAAAGMLARLYMFRRNFSAAKPYLEAIINSGKFRKDAEYVDCFSDKDEYSGERVWAIEFTGGQLGKGTSYPTSAFPQGLPTVNPYMPFSGYNTAVRVSQSMIEAYEPGDLRKGVTAITNVLFSTGLDTVSWWCTKYIHYVKYKPQAANDWATNFNILRYTDVEMMYAEVLNEQGYNAHGDAFRIINEVRARAGLPPLDPAVVSDQSKFREAIKHERRVEFSWEGLRWLDLIRWGDVVQVMNEFFKHPDEPKIGGVTPYSMKPHQILFQIPKDQLDRYNDINIMWQNPGYDSGN